MVLKRNCKLEIATTDVLLLLLRDDLQNGPFWYTVWPRSNHIIIRYYRQKYPRRRSCQKLSVHHLATLGE